MIKSYMNESSCMKNSNHLAVLVRFEDVLVMIVLHRVTDRTSDNANDPA